MGWASDLSRLRHLTWRDRLLLAEAAVSLATASIAIRAVPFRRLMTSLRAAREPAASEAQISEEIARAHWAIQACARRLPWRIVCFQKGLALYRLLRRRSIATILHYGVTQDRGIELKAHVWLTRNGRPVIGGEEAKNFTCLASFPRQKLDVLPTF